MTPFEHLGIVTGLYLFIFGYAFGLLFGFDWRDYRTFFSGGLFMIFIWWAFAFYNFLPHEWWTAPLLITFVALWVLDGCWFVYEIFGE